MEYVRCDLCGADSPVHLFRRRDRFSREEFDYVRCSRCGLIYINPRPWLDELSGYYPDDYEAYSPTGTSTMARRWRQRHGFRILRRFIGRYHPAGALLDVGCATGGFLAHMRRHGWHVQGVEMNSRMAAVAREVRGLKIFGGPFVEFEADGNTFDVITMWDVLEHLPSPMASLQRVGDLLSSQGVFIFTVPNLQSFDARLFGDCWIGWDAPRHLYLFSPGVLKELLTKTGFEVYERRCLLGGPGAFDLSWRFWIREKWGAARLSPRLRQLTSALFPFLLWPYKEFSYLVNRGPVMTIAAGKRS